MTLQPMNKPLAYTALALSTLFSVSCSLNQQETDGRKYYSESSPLQGKMGAHFKRVPTTTPEGTVVTQGTKTDTPAGLMDIHEKPDEPGAHYWMHGQQSANPLEGKMGVRVKRVKKDEGQPLFH